ncbi:MAG: trypsin-like cysteine/serine peptidase domain-containing protein [Benjaminiella poitrasii]|nr:MAG: trypsin-like cysteine/serine peptidase domain-containing protein [Benjaminiella poitrasii]
MYICILLFIVYFANIISAISRGNTVESSHQYPFFVTLTDPILCGGSIISLDPPWILTAAHCIESLVIRNNNRDYSVAYGSRNFSRQTYAAVKRAFTHPLYVSAQQLQTQVYATDRSNFIPYDIGLLELREPLKANRHVNRIPILTANVNATEQEHITMGMGYTGYGQSYANILQSAKCNITNSDLLKSNNFNHSILLATSNAELCHGDSGSPLLLYDLNDENYYLEGILNRILFAYDPDPNSATCPLHESNMTSFVNTFVKPSIHLNWIMNVTQLSKRSLTNTPETNISDTTFLTSSSDATFLFPVHRLLIIVISAFFLF